MPPDYQPGDKVECIHDADWQNQRQERDAQKARKLGRRRFFSGNASAYMHLDEAYVVVKVTDSGGLRLRGFASTISPRDVRLSTKPVFR